MTSTQPTSIRTILRSSDFSCPSCVSKIEKQLIRVAGVHKAAVHFNTGRVEVEHDPEVAPVETLIAAVARAGFTATRAAF